MAYQTYTTDALVIGSADQHTADRVVTLLTREAGLVYARALGVRKEQSKLRYGLQDFSRARVSLVRGKGGWRVIGAERADNLYFAVNDRETRAALLRTVRLVRRLVRGEEPHIAFYDTLVGDLAVLATCSGERLASLERALMLRVLSVLGYVAPKDAYREILSARSLTEVSAGVHTEVMETRTITRAIEEALVASQL